MRPWLSPSPPTLQLQLKCATFCSLAFRNPQAHAARSSAAKLLGQRNRLQSAGPDALPTNPPSQKAKHAGS
eukprot:6112386-Alexandrium_andersonii.AAC.1